MPSLHFKGKTFVLNHHLAVPFHELTPVKSKGTSKTPSLHDNLIVEGDNLRALKALLPTYSGKVKCIYIDPPYNTGNEHWRYNDAVNSPMMQEWLGKEVDREDLTRHDKWCCMMLPRLKLLREFLTDDGAIFVSIDDNEVHRLRCLMDEIFGEGNSIATFIWEKRTTRENRRVFSFNHDFVVCYAAQKERFEITRNLLPMTDEIQARYGNLDADPRGEWQSVSLNAQAGHATKDQFYKITTPSGRVLEAPSGRCWLVTKKRFDELVADNRVWFGETGNNVPREKVFLSEARKGITPHTIWTADEVGTTDTATKEFAALFAGTGRRFDNPKPSTLISQILQIATDKDSIVMDSFAGSGTTAHAVLALNQQDGGSRRFVLVECEDYVDSITAERIRRVAKGVPDAKDDTLRAGFAGTFSYFKLGRPMEKHSLLEGDALPSFEALASYVFFTATGEMFDAARIDRKAGFIGESRNYDVFLFYADDVATLRNLALDLGTARALPSVSGKRKLVFAPTRYLDDHWLDRLRIDFQQLPYQIYEALDT